MPNIEHLTKLLEVLSELPPEQTFDLAEFAGFHDSEGYVSEPDEACGTVACACGYGALHPYFMDLGFRLVASNRLVPHFEVNSIEHFNTLVKEERQMFFNIRFADKGGVDAAMEFFGISVSQFEHMFHTVGYHNYEWKGVTIPQVIEHIRDVIEGKV
jgi:hypothetical protein